MGITARFTLLVTGGALLITASIFVWSGDVTGGAFVETDTNAYWTLVIAGTGADTVEVVGRVWAPFAATAGKGTLVGTKASLTLSISIGPP